MTFFENQFAFVQNYSVQMLRLVFIRRQLSWRPQHLPIAASSPFSPIFSDINRAPSTFLEKYVGNEEFDTKYNNDFKLLKQEVKELKETVSCIEQNYDFLKTVMRLYEHKKFGGHLYSKYQDRGSRLCRSKKNIYLI